MNINKIIIGIGLAWALAFSVEAVDVSKNIATTYGTNLLSTPATVSQIILTTDSSSAGTVRLYDNGATNFFVTNAAYSTTTFAPGSVTNIYTNYFGVNNTNIYTALIATSNYVAAATNLLPGVFVVVVPTNTTLTFDGPYIFNRGILATNASGTGNGVAATITYR